MTTPRRAPMGPDELANRVEEHERWLASTATEGVALVLEDVVIQGANLPARKLQRSALTRVRFERCDLVDLRFGGSTFDGVEFVDCDLTRAALGSSKFVGGGIVSCTCQEAGMGSSEYTGFEIRGSAFKGSVWAKSVIRSSTLAGIDLGGANLLKLFVVDSDLQDCDFTGATMLKAHIAGTDLRRACFTDTDVDRLLLVDVRMAGCRGVPRDYGSMRIKRVDLSSSGDGSDLLHSDMVETLVAALRAEDR